jgi:drug/metabolite transporter (DMT)-like permease
LFGASAPAASRLAGDVNAFVLAGLLYLGAGLAVLPATLLRPPTRLAVGRGRRQVAVAVVVGGGVAPVFLGAGLARTPAATVSLLLNFELVATVILAAAIFHEQVGRRVGVGTALIVIGGAALTWSAAPELRVGALLVVAACVCWAVDNCVTATVDSLAPHHITAAKGLIAGAANLALGLAIGHMPSWSQIVSALAIGALGYGISLTLWIAGARDLGAARSQLIFAAAPFAGAAIAWIVFAEPLLLNQVLAGALALIGVLAVLDSSHFHEHRHGVLDHDHEHVHEDGHHGHRHSTPSARHAHEHHHVGLVHAHAHMPDLHHRHGHS